LEIGGRDRARTGDPLLAKQVLSQLSYTPPYNSMILIDFREGDHPLSEQDSRKLNYTCIRSN
jgi:hypothetical protein